RLLPENPRARLPCVELSQLRAGIAGELGRRGRAGGAWVRRPHGCRYHQASERQRSDGSAPVIHPHSLLSKRASRIRSGSTDQQAPSRDATCSLTSSSSPGLVSSKPAFERAIEAERRVAALARPRLDPVALLARGGLGPKYTSTEDARRISRWLFVRQGGRGSEPAHVNASVRP